MRLAAHSDLAATVDEVFAALTDFPVYERMALRRGVRFHRLDEQPVPGLGAGWHAQFAFRGRQTQATSHVTTYAPPYKLGLEGVSGGYDFSIAALLVALSRETTRLRFDVEIKPRTLGARIMLQTMKLGKSRLESRFRARAETFAEQLHRRLLAARPLSR